MNLENYPFIMDNQQSKACLLCKTHNAELFGICYDSKKLTNNV